MDRINEIAFAIYAEFSRERDPARARRRFERLPEHVLNQFKREAKAADRVSEAFRIGDYT